MHFCCSPAGIPEEPKGPVRRAAMDHGRYQSLFDDARIKTIAFAGHPYGNPNTVAANTAR